MRFLLLDRVEEITLGQHLRARIALPRSLAYPVGRPDQGGPSPALLLESLAQASGWLIKVTQDFRVLAIMSIIQGFRIHLPLPAHGLLHVHVSACPGSALLHAITGTLRDGQGRTLASVDQILYVSVPVVSDDWGRQAWQALHGQRRLQLSEGRQ